VLAALQRGSIIEAIKLLRESTGLGLKEAKDLIDQHLSGHLAPLTTTLPPASLPPGVVAALHRGNTIEAIRLLREATGLGLKEAKDAVDAFQSGNQIEPMQRSPGEVPRSSVGIWLVAALAALALLAYYFFGRSG
jgi:DNA-binding transcriptional MerR regulator